MSKHLGSYCLLSMVILFIASSCGEYESLEIQKSAKRSADSLYRLHRDSLKKVGDSLCDIYWVEYYNEAFDSMKADKFLKAKELMRK